MTALMGLRARFGDCAAGVWMQSGIIFCLSSLSPKTAKIHCKACDENYLFCPPCTEFHALCVAKNSRLSFNVKAP